MLPIIAITWACMIGTGFTAMLYYHNMPGERNDRTDVWPVNELIDLDNRRANLVAFLHPQCACSTATLGELARIQSTCGNRLAIHVAFYRPDGEAWDNTRTVRQALDIPNVHIMSDADGKLAKRFGAETSGHVFLYSLEGRRLFSGGITPARAHEGDNLGRNTIVEYVLNGKANMDQTHVYGCPIFDDPVAQVTSSGGPVHVAE